MRPVTDQPPPMLVEPVTLEGHIVRLEPLEERHYPGLIEVGLAPDLWRWTVEWIDTPALLTQYLDIALRARDEGSQLPFVTVELSSGRPIGSTRYLNIERHHHRLEIGYTWVAPAWQRTGANVEAKLLQMRHAFETLGCRRVEFKTDSLNPNSNAALLGIGATFEGIFRNHMISQGGRMRHSSYYSVIDAEWPDVRQRLEKHIEAHLALRG
jgi:N-acetyltransferase